MAGIADGAEITAGQIAGLEVLAFSRGAQAGARFLLDADVTTAGRDVAADILLDDDTPDIFQRTLDFLLDANIEALQTTRMTPFPGTPLYKRLEQEKRLLNLKLYAALAYCRANRLDRLVIDSPQPRLGILTAGGDSPSISTAPLGVPAGSPAAAGLRSTASCSAAFSPHSASISPKRPVATNAWSVCPTSNRT